MLARFFIVGLLAIAAGQASALNKCTGPDGKVTYQDAACSAASKASEIRVPVGPEALAEQWRFSRERDSMTGVETCFAVSPTTYTNWSRGMVTHSQVYLQLAVSKQAHSMVLSVRTFQSGGGSFHIDVAQQGIKPDAGEFFPLVTKFGSYGLGVAEGQTPALIGALQRSKNFTLRLRFWPYEQLHDTQPVSLLGFERAVKAAMQCAV